MNIKFFDILKDILLKGNGELYKNPSFQQSFNIYMLIRYLSMKQSLIIYANKLNLLYKVLNNEEIYLWCYNNIPKQTSSFIKYIKKQK